MKRYIIALVALALTACNEPEAKEEQASRIAEPAPQIQEVSIMVWHGDMGYFDCFSINNTIYCKGSLAGAYDPNYTPFIVSSSPLGLATWLDSMCAYIEDATSQPFSRNPGPAAYCWSYRQDGDLTNFVSPATSVANGTIEVSFGYNPPTAYDSDLIELQSNSTNIQGNSGNNAVCQLSGLTLTCPDFEIELVQ